MKNNNIDSNQINLSWNNIGIKVLALLLISIGGLSLKIPDEDNAQGEIEKDRIILRVSTDSFGEDLAIESLRLNDQENIEFFIAAKTKERQGSKLSSNSFDYLKSSFFGMRSPIGIAAISMTDER